MANFDFLLITTFIWNYSVQINATLCEEFAILLVLIPRIISLLNNVPSFEHGYSINSAKFCKIILALSDV